MTVEGPATGIVIIGRNEGERLRQCLQSVQGLGEIVYVDSGSTDGSPAAAAAAGATVVELDMSRPFSAARARNAGAERLSDTVQAIQFVDGDCTVAPGWIEAGREALAADGRLAGVFGRLRERFPRATRYNWLCDVEWARTPGPATTFGGLVMLRRRALDEAGGYDGAMIAGEEPDLAIRMRARGWTVLGIPHEMALHDAAMTRFGQWWRRSVRSGHAYADLAARHDDRSLHDYDRRLRSAVVWGGAIPLAAIVTLVAAVLLSSWTVAAIGVALAGLPFAQMLRLFLRERRTRAPTDALTVALFLMLAKPAQCVGLMRYRRDRRLRRPSKLIEYRAP